MTFKLWRRKNVEEMRKELTFPSKVPGINLKLLEPLLKVGSVAEIQRIKDHNNDPP